MSQLGLSASQRYWLWIVISNCLLLRASQGPQISRCQFKGHWCLKPSSSWAMALDKPSSWYTQVTLLLWESSLGLLGAIDKNADLMYFVSFSSSRLLGEFGEKEKSPTWLGCVYVDVLFIRGLPVPMGIGGVDWEICKVYLQGCRAEDGGRPEELHFWSPPRYCSVIQALRL